MVWIKKTLIYKTVQEIKNQPGLDSWNSRVDKIKFILKIPTLYGKSDKVGIVIDKLLKGKFDRFFLDEINEEKLGQMELTTIS